MEEKTKSSKKTKPFAAIEQAIQEESSTNSPNSDENNKEIEEKSQIIKSVNLADDILESGDETDSKPEKQPLVRKTTRKSFKAIIKEELVGAMANNIFEEAPEANSERNAERESEIESKKDEEENSNEKSVESVGDESGEVSINASEDVSTEECKDGSEDHGQEVIEQPIADQPVWKTLYTYCERCQNYIYAYYQEKMITEAQAFPVYLVWVHGRPLHGLLLRIDRNFTSRGERIVNIEFDMNALQPE
jgi:hypothetical protein